MNQGNTYLAERLRQLRERKGWTLEEASEHSGVYPSYISAIETRRRSAGKETLKKLADAYAEPRSRSHKLFAELLKIKADEPGGRAMRQRAIELILRNQGVFGKLIFKAICLLEGEDLKRSQFQIVREPENLKVDWDTKEVGGAAVIRLRGKNYRVRLMVSEEPEVDSTK
jgi:transcriptional regulator with XRE-family HTH domain